ncbi:MAG: glycosyltransferase family 39 protein [Candidatus Omnitrophota bacterium]
MKYDVKKILFFIFVSAAAVKIGLVLFLNRPEAFEYEAISRNILAGKGFSCVFYLGTEYKALVQPFYPIFSAVVYYFTNHSYLAMFAIQSVVSSAICFVVYHIAVRLMSQRCALLAAFTAAFHPGLAVYSIVKLHPLVFDAFFYLLALCAFLVFMEKPLLKNALLAGAASGAAVLSRSTIVIFLVFMAFFLFFVLKGLSVRAKLKLILVVYMTAFMVYLPWIVRNYAVFHKIVIMQTDTGENLWTGNNESTTGSSMLPSGNSVHDTMSLKMRGDLKGMDELGQQGYYTDCFFDFIKDNPVLFAGLLLKKLFYFWWFSPYTGALYDKSWLDIYKVYYAVVVLLSVLGLAGLFRQRRNLVTLSVFFAYMIPVSLIHAVACIDTRHRWTIEPVLLILASAGVCRLFAKYFKRSVGHEG